MISMGIDIGSSSVKVALLDIDTGKEVVSAFFPEEEMPIIAQKHGWAEQNPDMWFDAFVQCVKKIKVSHQKELQKTKLIGISYQMHGLVCIDKAGDIIRPSIIWCDSRAVDIGEEAMRALGKDFCLQRLLNSPGNFTASKLRWVKENEPKVYAKIYKIMLPGDYISYRLTGEINTTITGLSEGVMWDFTTQTISDAVLDAYEIDKSFIPSIGKSFQLHGQICNSIAQELGISMEASVYYKAGDQPNNALALNVMEEGEIATTAGTSGVVYALTKNRFVDKKQRVNTFAHVNYEEANPMHGVLLCINGVGIANSWIKRVTKPSSYHTMNENAAMVRPGSDGVVIFPFGNGAERMLQNREVEAHISGLNFNIHQDAHLWRATQEGVAYAFAYGMKSFAENDMPVSVMKAGNSNMFLSQVFRQVLADVTSLPIHLYNTDGALGAARGAVIGAGLQSPKEAFSSLQKTNVITPGNNQAAYQDLYAKWRNILTEKLDKQ